MAYVYTHLSPDLLYLTPFVRPYSGSTASELNSINGSGRLEKTIFLLTSPTISIFGGRSSVDSFPFVGLIGEEESMRGRLNGGRGGAGVLRRMA